jgi:hypothetical protein
MVSLASILNTALIRRYLYDVGRIKKLSFDYDVITRLVF